MQEIKSQTSPCFMPSYASLQYKLLQLFQLPSVRLLLFIYVSTAYMAASYEAHSCKGFDLFG